MMTMEDTVNPEEENFYRILEVENTSTLVEIRNAYEKKLEEVHLEAIAAYSLLPEEETEKKILMYGQAYVTLANPIARAKYDDELHQLKYDDTTEKDPYIKGVPIYDPPIVKKSIKIKSKKSSLKEKTKNIIKNQKIEL